MAKALIVVDVQKDFCEGGSLAVPGGTTVASKISQYVASADYDLIVATRDAHIDPGAHFSDDPDFINSWPPHCVVGTSGQNFHPALDLPRLNSIFDKGNYEASYSGFEGKNNETQNLDTYLTAHNVTDIDCVGIATDFCVKQTAFDGQKLGYNTRVLHDLTAAVFPADLDITISDLRDHGIRVIATTNPVTT